MKLSSDSLDRVATHQGKVRKKIFFQGQEIVREFKKLSGKFWKGANVREMSGNSMEGFLKSILYHNFHTWYHLALQFWTELLIIMTTNRVLNGPGIMEKSLNLTNRIPGLKKSWNFNILSQIQEKSGESSSENFSVIYSFEARMTTDASVHHFLSFLRFLNINVLDHTLCRFLFSLPLPKGLFSSLSVSPFLSSLWLW